MFAGGEAVSDNKKTPTTLLDDLAALDPAQRHEVATELRNLSGSQATGRA